MNASMRITMSSVVGLGVFDHDIEVAILVEDARVEQLEFGPLPPWRRFSSISRPIGKLVLRILVEELHVGMGRGVVEVEVVLLDVLAVVALDGRERRTAAL